MDIVYTQGAYLMHHGIKGQKWGVRRYQNEDGTLTEEGRKRYLDYDNNKLTKKGLKLLNKSVKTYQTSREYTKKSDKALNTVNELLEGSSHQDNLDLIVQNYTQQAYNRADDLIQKHKMNVQNLKNDTQMKQIYNEFSSQMYKESASYGARLFDDIMKSKGRSKKYQPYALAKRAKEVIEEAMPMFTYDQFVNKSLLGV